MIVLFFLLGVGAGRMLPISGDPLVQRGTSGVLLLLIFLVGVGVGSNVKVWRILREMHMRILLVPLSASFAQRRASIPMYFRPPSMTIS